MGDRLRQEPLRRGDTRPERCVRGKVKMGCREREGGCGPLRGLGRSATHAQTQQVSAKFVAEFPQTESVLTGHPQTQKEGRGERRAEGPRRR